MSDKTLYIVRHGQTEWNVALRMQGRLDSPLTGLGRVQADLHGRTLARHGGVDALYVSPLGRTRDTARLLNAHLDAPVTYRDELVERDCGLWSAMTLHDIELAYPEEWRARGEDPYHHRPPQGENLEDMEARVGDLIDALLEAPEGRIALVTHGVMSRVIIKRVLALEPQEAIDVRHPNELFYRVTVGASGRPDSAYFLEGQAPRPGLLRKNQGETILGSRR